MKKTIISLFIIVLAFTTFLVSETNAQCRQQLVYACATHQDPNASASIYLRDFNTKLRRATKTPVKETGTKWTIVLNKDAKYRFNLCVPDGVEGQVVLTLYDSQHPEFSKPYCSTYDKDKDKDYPSFDFVCQKSGMYYVSIRFKENSEAKKTCAVGILSFVSSGGK